MINKSTTTRFAVLTPFQEPITYYMRLYDADGLATDDYKTYNLGRSRAREATHMDYSADRLSLFAEMLQRIDKIFELWQPVLDAVQMPRPSKDDYLVDCRGQGWTIIDIKEEFHSNVFTLGTMKRV